MRALKPQAEQVKRTLSPVPLMAAAETVAGSRGAVDAAAAVKAAGAAGVAAGAPADAPALPPALRLPPSPLAPGPPTPPTTWVAWHPGHLMAMPSRLLPSWDLKPQALQVKGTCSSPGARLALLTGSVVLMREIDTVSPVDGASLSSREAICTVSHFGQVTARPMYWSGMRAR